MTARRRASFCASWDRGQSRWRSRGCRRAFMSGCLPAAGNLQPPRRQAADPFARGAGRAARVGPASSLECADRRRPRPHRPWPARAGLILDPDGGRLAQDRPLAQDELRAGGPSPPGPAISSQPGRREPADRPRRRRRGFAGRACPTDQVAAGAGRAGCPGQRQADRRRRRKPPPRGPPLLRPVAGGRRPGYFGLSRNARVTTGAGDDERAAMSGRLSGCAVNLEDPTQDHRFDRPLSGPVDLAELLPEGPGLWLVQSRLDGGRSARSSGATLRPPSPPALAASSATS